MLHVKLSPWKDGHIDWEITSPFNLLLGENGVGKSSLLRSIETTYENSNDVWFLDETKIAKNLFIGLPVSKENEKAFLQIVEEICVQDHHKNTTLRWADDSNVVGYTVDNVDYSFYDHLGDGKRAAIFIAYRALTLPETYTLFVDNAGALMSPKTARGFMYALAYHLSCNIVLVTNSVSLINCADSIIPDARYGSKCEKIYDEVFVLSDINKGNKIRPITQYINVEWLQNFCLGTLWERGNLEPDMEQPTIMEQNNE